MLGVHLHVNFSKHLSLIQPSLLTPHAEICPRWQFLNRQHASLADKSSAGLLHRHVIDLENVQKSGQEYFHVALEHFLAPYWEMFAK